MKNLFFGQTNDSSFIKTEWVSTTKAEEIYGEVYHAKHLRRSFSRK